MIFQINCRPVENIRMVESSYRALTCKRFDVYVKSSCFFLGKTGIKFFDQLQEENSSVLVFVTIKESRQD